jgi:hypothetical protein
MLTSWNSGKSWSRLHRFRSRERSSGCPGREARSASSVWSWTLGIFIYLAVGAGALVRVAVRHVDGCWVFWIVFEDV